jgi:hypothetical protein
MSLADRTFPVSVSSSQCGETCPYERGKIKIFKFTFPLLFGIDMKQYVKPRIRKYSILFRFRPEDKVMDLRKRGGKVIP